MSAVASRPGRRRFHNLPCPASTLHALSSSSTTRQSSPSRRTAQTSPSRPSVADPNPSEPTRLVRRSASRDGSPSWPVTSYFPASGRRPVFIPQLLTMNAGGQGNCSRDGASNRLQRSAAALTGAWVSYRSPRGEPLPSPTARRPHLLEPEIVTRQAVQDDASGSHGLGGRRTAGRATDHGSRHPPRVLQS